MKKLTMLATLTMSALVLVGCAKDKPYDEVYKAPEVGSKGLYQITQKVTQKNGSVSDEPVKYLYVPMTMGTPREVPEAMPFYQGQEKIVRLQWSKDGLEVLEVEKDERFSDNDLNDTPVLTIPGNQLSYRCREDAYGECTNNEEVNSEQEWYDTTHFKPDFEGLKVKEVNELDVFALRSSCLSPNGTKLVDYEVQPGVINVELEKTYKVNKSWNCLWTNYIRDNFSYNGFKVRFFYSLVRLDKLASPGYKAVDYPTPDHDEFGYFKNEELVLKDDFDSQRKERKILLNRWNPERNNGELVYHLSDSFNKPENALLKKATYDTIEAMNNGLKKIGSPFTIKLEEPSGKKSGDLRYNMVVLIDDPLANGLLGYGPTVTNPQTGEIVQGHVNMYGGVLKAMTRSVYESAVDISIDEVNEKKGESVAQVRFAVAPSALGNLPESLAVSNIQTQKVPLPSQIQPLPTKQAPAVASKNAEVASSKMNVHAHSHALKGKLHNHDHHAFERRAQERISTTRDMRLDIAQSMNKEELDDFQKEVQKEQERLNHYAENNAYATEFFQVGGTAKVIYPELLAIADIKNEDGTLKRWNELSASQKSKATDIILVKSYRSTLVHEFGHNLGLRHNFMGSWDKENFYTKEEAKTELGLDDAPAYSSIMDYGFSQFNELNAFGKYDLAALRFAYKREVETKDGSIVKVKGAVSDLEKELKANGQELKSYQYCTDENAGLSSMCNRFDEGTSLVEIANHRIKRYKDYYKYRNFRDERLNFSTYGLGSYVVWRYIELSGIRDIFEEYEFFTTFFGKDLMAQGCSPQDTAQYPVCKQINDRLEATKIVGNFFMDVLKTPDHLCAVVNTADPRVVTEYKKLSEIYDDIKYTMSDKGRYDVVTSCFDEEVVAKLAEDSLVPVAENGKFLNSFRDTNPEYKYSSDIAVRGYWVDKVMAMRMLFKREWYRPSTDDEHMALVDLPFIYEDAKNVINHLAMGEPMNAPLPFTMADGQKVVLPYAIAKDYKINNPEDAFVWVKMFLGLPLTGKGNLIDTTLAQIEKSGVDYGEDYRDQAYLTANYASIRRLNIYLSLDQRPEGFSYLRTNDDRVYAANENNTVAYSMLSTINGKEVLDSANSELITKVLEQRMNPQAPAELTDAQKAYFSLDESWQVALINYANQGAQFTLEIFSQQFGAEQGPLLFEIYTAGAQAMSEVVTIKDQIANTPSSDEEKPLFDLPIALLYNYANGFITDALVDYYKAQLRVLPRHRYRNDDGTSVFSFL
ncbi:zinc-dependent metalloprotease [Halobacteriovorax sp. GB3]|uniref:zinc-dependent metalloprotease n=1 Tax=Halobacteriovorax sp. GB3 TaxID=2719615 RepID=UPI00235EB3A2|nr:zinc-dependent metalloprotease [Halobacteriovorax sp. GB3]MDD0853301.1 zinc-dependent metalloprotease [Halobacteriovorax sp. GB3]